jgi:alkylhydroperoxidase family enzyme
LDLAESVTRVADHQVPDDVYARAAAVLDQPEITATVWMAITMNAFNRIAITSRYPA